VVRKRAVAKITRSDLPIFANHVIGADQAHYFAGLDDAGPILQPAI
jgi:hypothetical protein